jgi:hypothetical protein
MTRLLALNDHLIAEFIIDPLYDVRCDGTIWSVVSRQGHTTAVWREIGYTKRSGYRIVRYRREHLLVHRVVFAKHKGELSESFVINHIDGIPSNNCPANLELVTQSVNILHRFRVLGRKPVIGNAKITQEIAEEIRAASTNGATYRELMRKYSLSKSTISYVVNSRTWKSEA